MRILIVGSTGYFGRYLAKAAIRLNHEAFLLVRSSAYHDPEKARFLQSMEASGATILQGSLEDYASLLESVSKVEAVISCVSWGQVTSQLDLIKAIVQAGTVKRFIPSEFGGDGDRIKGIRVLEEHRYGTKVQVRRAIEAAGIPYTYISSNTFAGLFLCNLAQPGLSRPPLDKINIYGDGNTEAIFVDEDDIATFTLKCVDDPRTLNKTLYIRPAENTLSQNEMVAIWEEQSGRKLERVPVSGEQLLKQIEELPHPKNITAAFLYSMFVRGDQTNFQVECEATRLYPDVTYVTAASYLQKYSGN